MPDFATCLFQLGYIQAKKAVFSIKFTKSS